MATSISKDTTVKATTPAKLSLDDMITAGNNHLINRSIQATPVFLNKLKTCLVKSISDGVTGGSITSDLTGPALTTYISKNLTLPVT